MLVANPNKVVPKLEQSLEGAGSSPMVDDEEDEEEQEQGFQDILEERPQLKAQMKREAMVEEDIKIPVRNN
jgi:hypothetical protein